MVLTTVKDQEWGRETVVLCIGRGFQERGGQLGLDPRVKKGVIPMAFPLPP